MKVNAIIRIVLTGVFALVTFPVHADQMSDLCTILNTSRNNEAALNRQIANERNPLKQSSLQQQLGQVAQQREASLNNFLNVNRRQFAHFTGVISAFRFFNYSNGPGADVSIELPCKITIYFQFIDRVGELGGAPRPEDETPLAKWRTALENVVVGNSVTFSGRFAQNNGISRAVMTELQKRGGAAYKVPDPLLPPTTGTFSHPTVVQGDLIWMPPEVMRNWSGANAYCQGMPGWRLPTQNEVQNLVRSGAINGRGWFSPGMGQAALTSTSAGPGLHMMVFYQTGEIYALGDENQQSITCVRASGSTQRAAVERQGAIVAPPLAPDAPGSCSIQQLTGAMYMTNPDNFKFSASRLGQCINFLPEPPNRVVELQLLHSPASVTGNFSIWTFDAAAKGKILSSCSYVGKDPNCSQWFRAQTYPQWFRMTVSGPGATLKLN